MRLLYKEQAYIIITIFPQNFIKRGLFYMELIPGLCLIILTNLLANKEILSFIYWPTNNFGLKPEQKGTILCISLKRCQFHLDIQISDGMLKFNEHE